LHPRLNSYSHPYLYIVLAYFVKGVIKVIDLKQDLEFAQLWAEDTDK